MLQEAANDAFDLNGFRQPFDAGSQTANPANNQPDRNPCLARRIQRVNHIGINKRVHLRPDAARLAGRGHFGFGADHSDEIERV